MAVLGQVAATTDLADAIWPPGTILPYAGDTAPAGWILCDGQTAVGPGTALGVALGGASPRFGADGSGNPKVPDMRGRVPVGMDDPNIGTTGGTLDHSHGVGTLALAAHGHTHNLAWPDHSHSHGLSIASHGHNVGMNTSSINNSNDSAIAAVTDTATGGNQPGVTGGIGSPTATGASGSPSTASPAVQGSSATANAPFVTFLYIIKQ